MKERNERMHLDEVGLLMEAPEPDRQFDELGAGSAAQTPFDDSNGKRGLPNLAATLIFSKWRLRRSSQLMGHSVMRHHCFYELRMGREQGFGEP